MIYIVKLFGVDLESYRGRVEFGFFFFFFIELLLLLFDVFILLVEVFVFFNLFVILFFVDWL